ncbi:DMT family transporter [Halomarina ordinaria]|uniref:DMT family transporter n=1 Tax=Halomarina ordinaria TaxID=3033939 RepID=A0ABD5U4E2_9EURY|nr:EamA family transporter [Halomarina sp. PSRA2]
MSLTTTCRGLPRDGLLFALLAAFWGTSFVAIEIGLEHFPPLLFAGLRYVVAGGIILGYAVLTADRLLPATRGDWAAVGVVGAFIIAGYHGLLYLGELYVSGAVASVVISLSPVLTAVFASVLLADDYLGPVEAGGLAFGLLGVVVVAAPTPGAVAGTNLLGVGLVFLGGACFALGAVLTRPVQSTMPLSSLEGWGMVVGSALLFAGADLRGESLAAIDWSGPALPALVYLTLVSGVVAFLIYFTLLDRVGPTEINLIGYVEPAVAALVSWAVLGHLVDATTLAGFVAIFVGFALIKRDTLSSLAGRSRSLPAE